MLGSCGIFELLQVSHRSSLLDLIEVDFLKVYGRASPVEKVVGSASHELLRVSTGAGAVVIVVPLVLSPVLRISCVVATSEATEMV